jgi:hypothetical protein
MERNDRQHLAPHLPGTLTSRRSSVLLDEADGRVVVRLRHEVDFVLDDHADMEDVFDRLASLQLAPGGPKTPRLVREGNAG